MIESDFCEICQRPYAGSTSICDSCLSTLEYTAKAIEIEKTASEVTSYKCKYCGNIILGRNKKELDLKINNHHCERKRKNKNGTK